MQMYPFLRSLLFKLDPETAHHLTLQLLRLGGRQPISTILQEIFATPDKPVEVFGLTFRNPVGLAAGYDKDGIAWRGLFTLGFGHIEVGTVTPHPQPGNPKPRLFRLVEDKAVINRMGFPGQGAEFVARQLKGKRLDGLILGVNLGKNKDTPLEEAANDYISLMQTFAPLAGYLAINVSSPNTADLRRLQGGVMLEGLLSCLAEERNAQVNKLNRRLPILVKLAPDLTDEELEDALDAILRTGMDGVITTNTTLARDGLKSLKAGEAGGLSGSPLTVRSDTMLAKVVKRIGGQMPVVGVGGILSPEDARRKLDLGATLVQVYTGMIYAGPGLVKRILRAI